MTSPSRKIGEKRQSDREKLQCKNDNIFRQFISKLAITYPIAIKCKEKYDAVVVDCHHSLPLYGDRMKMSLLKKILPGSHFG